MSDQVAAIESRFGVTLRSHQATAIERVLQGHSVALHVPTGGGKSLVFQGLSYILPQMTVVIYPLRALVKDQERRLQDMGIPGAAYYGATKTGDRARILEGVTSGTLHLILTTPETLLLNRKLVAAIQARGVSLLVIDEAHVYEDWAETFRPAYRRLADCVRTLGPTSCMVCSATLTAYGLAKAAQALGTDRWSLVQAPAVRPNLRYVNCASRFTQSRFKRVWKVTPPEALGLAPGIAFFTWVNTLEAVAPEGALTYHGSLTAKRRRTFQEEWTAGASWIYATKAFGMGIDKANVRSITHLQLPDSILSYAQEAGRAGRDGLPAACALDPRENGEAAEFLLEMGIPPPSVLWPVYDHLRRRTPDEDGWCALEADRIAAALHISDMTARAAVVWLASGDFIERNAPDDTWTINLGGVTHPTGNEAADAVLEILHREMAETGPEIGREVLEDALAEIGDWERPLKRLEKLNRLTYTKPPRHRARVRVLQDRATSRDLQPLVERCRQVRERAFERLSGMRDLANAAPERRAGLIERAITLDPREVEHLIRER